MIQNSFLLKGLWTSCPSLISFLFKFWKKEKQNESGVVGGGGSFVINTKLSPKKKDKFVRLIIICVFTWELIDIV